MKAITKISRNSRVCALWAALLSAIFAFCFDVYAADVWPSWQSIQVDQLATFDSSTISSIHRSYNGEVYIATAESLYIFDGEEVRELPVRWATNHGYPLDRVLGFSSGHDGTAWVYTVRDGIYSKPAQSEGFHLEPEIDGWNVGDQVVAALNIEKPAGVLSLSEGRAFFLSFSTRKSIRVDDIRSATSVIGIGTTPSGTIFVIDGENWLTYYEWNENGGWLAKNSVHCALEDAPTGKVSTLDGEYFVAASQERRIVTFRNYETSCEQVRSQGQNTLGAELQDTRVRDAWPLTKSGYLAVATDDGLYIHNEETTELLNTKNSLLRSNQITAVTEISKDQLLVGSYLGLIGAFRGDTRTITRLSDEGLPEVTSISSSNGKIYASTYRGLYELDDQNPNVFVSKINLPVFFDGISVIESSGANLLVGTTDGRVVVFDTSSKKILCAANTNTKDLITGFANGISLETYASTFTGKVFKISNCVDGQRAEVREVLDLNRSIIGLTATRKHALLTGLSGIYSVPTHLLDPAIGDHGLDLDQRPPPHPKAWVFSGSDSEFIFASPDGRVFFKGSPFSSQSSRIHVVPDTPYSIETDVLGRAWLASKKGLWLGSDEHEFTLAFRTKELSSIAFEYGASHRAPDGTLVFGGVGGLVLINNPKKLPRKRLSRLFVRSVQLSSDSFREKDAFNEFSIRGPSRIGPMSFKFSPVFEIGRDFYGVETLLSPIETDWTWHETFGPINIGPLPPGTYTFRARGANALGVWSENEIVIPITILPPAWRSWWALLLYALAAVLAAILIKRIYIRNVVREARIAYGEEAARAFSRLEDEWQEQREATDRLLRSIPVTVSSIIDSARTVVRSQGETTAGSDADRESVAPVLATIDLRLQALQQQRDICVLSTASQTCEAQKLINELVVLVTERAPYGSRYIVLDETAELTLTAGLGQTVAIIVMEVLELMISREPATDQTDPIITTCIERTTDGLLITVADRDGIQPSETLVDRMLATTLALLEDSGGSIAETDDFGYEIEIKLPEPTGTT